MATTLTLKVALQRLHRLEGELGIPIFPILGVGCAPFRGNFTPPNVLKVMGEYPSVQTYTVQSAFKYDYPSDVVTRAILQINEQPRGKPSYIDEERTSALIDKIAEAYQEQLLPIAGLVNRVARFVPPRRARKLHIGLFGYARHLGDVHLPRAIGFCAALYSIGLPPELLGLDALDEGDLRFIRWAYPGFDDELRDAARYFDPSVYKLLPEGYPESLEKALSLVNVEPDKEHREGTSRVVSALIHDREETITDLIVSVASARHFLG